MGMPATSPRKHNDAHATFSNGALHSDVQNTRHLLGIGDHFTVVTAFLEEDLWMSFLKDPCAISRVGMCEGDREHRACCDGIKQAMIKCRLPAHNARARSELSGY